MTEYLTFCAIMAVALICYRLDQLDSQSGKPIKRGAPVIWLDTEDPHSEAQRHAINAVSKEVSR